jgi:biotin carboxyl carrier protein
MKTSAFILFINILFAGCTHDHEDHSGHDRSRKEEPSSQHHGNHDEEIKSIHFNKEKQVLAGVETVMPEMSEVMERVSVPGIIKADPRYSFTISSTSRGIFSYSASGDLLHEGKLVKKGEILAVIYPVAQQEHWTQIEQAHNLAVVEKEFAQNEYERINDLAQKGVVPEKELLIAKNNLEASAQNLKFAEKRASQLQGGREKSIQIKASVSGVLRKIFIKSGMLVESGETLFEIVVPDKLMINGEILKGDIPSGSKIMSVSVKASDSEMTVITSADIKNRTYTFDYTTKSSEIVFPFESSGFYIGENVEIILRTGKGVPSLTVTSSSVIEIATRPHLVIMKETEIFEIIQVDAGADDGLKVEILKGLKETDRVVSKGAFEIYAASRTESMDAHAGHNH